MNLSTDVGEFRKVGIKTAELLYARGLPHRILSFEI